MSKLIVASPANGKVILTSKINDETFSKNMMGEGFGIITIDEKMCAPIDGTITLISGHAFAIKNNTGIEVLVHMGIDTVGIEDAKKAAIFKYLHKVGAKVKTGQVVVKVDWNAIKSLKYDTTSPVIVLKDSLDGKSVSIESFGQCKVGDAILSIE